MSPHFTNSEVKKKHLRRVPVITTPTVSLAYENEKCPNPDTCPDKQKCKKCHNEKEFMYHPLVYMTAKCNYGTSCKNRSRFCAFYHTEAERIESERNREELLKKLKRQKTIKRPSVTETVPSKWNSTNPAIKGLTQPDSKQNSSNADISNSVNDSDDVHGSKGSPEDHSRQDITQRKHDNQSVVNDSENMLTQETYGGNQFKNSGNSSDQGPVSGNFINQQGQYSTGYTSNRDNNTNGNNGFSRVQAPQYVSKQGISYQPPERRINEKLRYFPSKILSQRADGKIYEGKYLLHGLEYRVAVKEIAEGYLGNDVLNNDTLLQIQHRNIVKYHSVCYQNDSVYIVMDLHTQSLVSFLRKEAPLLRSNDGLSPLCKSLLHQLCSAVVYLHTEQQLAHCDLLPDNIFIEMHRDNNHRIILGDINRTCVRQPCKDDNFINTEREETYRYKLPVSEWTSPEETNLPSLTKEQLYQSDMWRLGMLIYYIITGEQYNPDAVPKFHINSQPWLSLSSVLLQMDGSLRLSASSLLQHPAFWYFLPSRLGDFYKQILVGNFPHDILTNLFSQPKVDSNKLLYPRNNWLQVIYPDNNYPSYGQNGTSVLRLIQLIVDVVTSNHYKDEHYSAVMRQATKQRVDSISFFHENFPCLVFKIWEMFFHEKKLLEKQKTALSDLLSS